jgi:hypothetical protein
MADEKAQIWIIGSLIAAITGMYGFFLRHVFGHVKQEQVADELGRVWEKKRSIETCNEIVKRFDENHKETCGKLDRILHYLEKGGCSAPKRRTKRKKTK